MAQSEQHRSPWVGQPAIEWNEDDAVGLRGAYVIIGISYVNGAQEPQEQIQMHGRVSVCERDRGICIELEGRRSGETYWLPLELRPFQPARLGEYRLRSTGEVIVDPDYTCSWTITRPAKT